ncbi:MAG: universal stress protein [Candidatus Koribacter versatilis]|uniref:Universal stress protein n=1 Tax=Candidatus Korobacter versatilis TaxID=658062 RepID=A0A932A7Q9_9BACT|nr:universal stress protein [Candidatus Koribacter versatilis]
MRTIERRRRAVLQLKNIIVATDFQRHSRAALNYAAMLARRFGARLEVVHAVPLAGELLVPGVRRSSGYLGRRTLSQRLMRSLALVPSLAGLRHAERVLEGEASDVVNRAATRAKADLLVIGTSARVGMGRILLGSVAEEILRTANCPVLVIGPKVRRLRQVSLDRILFATDLSSNSLVAAPHAFALATNRRARLTLLRAVHPDIRSASERIRIRREQTEGMRALLPRPLLSRTRLVVSFRHPAEAVLRVARRSGCNLIVMGVRGGGALPRALTHLPGSTACAVIAGSTCPVLTVRRR